MISFQTLLRRTAAALGAIAALTVTGPATSQTVPTVTLSTGPSCPYSSASLIGGNFSFVCSGVTTVTYTITAPSSLPQNFTTGSQIKIVRTGATTAAIDVNFAIVSGPCSASNAATSVNILAGYTSANLGIDTAAATGSPCVISIAAPPTGPPSSASIDIVNPDADATFAFATTTSLANVGGSPINIRVNRGGGTNGAFTVPLTLAGDLAPAGSLLAGNLSAAALSFAANDSFKNVIYTPPSTPPSVPSPPATLLVTFGAITGGTLPQIGTGSGTHTMTLNGPQAGCPVPETTAVSMKGAGVFELLQMPSGGIKTYLLPTPLAPKITGSFNLAPTTPSYPVAPWYYEVHINKCKGLVQSTPGDGCYGQFANATAIFSKVWFTKFTSSYDTTVKLSKYGYCHAPPSEGPWYVNVRYTYASCSAVGGVCGWHVQWTNWSY